jgi:hypothetical protein
MKNELRPETGVMQFGDDWPGVFIRGDNAFGYLMALQTAIRKLEEIDMDPLTRVSLQGLADLLASSDAHNHAETDPDIQMAVMHGAGYRYCAERGMVKKT